MRSASSRRRAMPRAASGARLTQETISTQAWRRASELRLRILCTLSAVQWLLQSDGASSEPNCRVSRRHREKRPVIGGRYPAGQADHGMSVAGRGIRRRPRNQTPTALGECGHLHDPETARERAVSCQTAPDRSRRFAWLRRSCDEMATSSLSWAEKPGELRRVRSAGVSGSRQAAGTVAWLGVRRHWVKRTASPRRRARDRR